MMAEKGPIFLAEERSISNDVVENASGKTPIAASIREVDGLVVLGMDQDDVNFYEKFTPQMRLRLNRKIDLRLLPLLATLYLVSNLDRANIGNAKIEGLAKDLKLTGVQYNTALAVFFISYILFNIPSNIILKQIKKPSWYLGASTITFGFIMTMHGVVQSFTGLALCRFLLGIFEAGFFPAATYICTAYYLPRELSLRLGAFYCTGAISGAFSGLLAAAITQMDGVGGYEGWRWIFIIEGLMTVVIGVITVFCLVDLPSNSTRWLSPDELRFLEVQRKLKQGGLSADGSDVEGGELGFQWYQLKMVFTNWRNCLLALCLACQAVGFYGVKFNLPTLTESMGFTSTKAQLLSVPPYILAGFMCVLIPHLSDRYGTRAAFLIPCFFAMTVGFAVVLSFQGDLHGSRVAPCPLLISWGTNNTAPAGRRAMISSMLTAVANFGGIAGSFMFLDREAPVYDTGYGLSVACGATGMIGSTVLYISWRHLNKRRAVVNEGEMRDKYTDMELLRLGDRSPLFKYQL
ncbi:inner membrane transport protein yfav [Diaporthe amygdali]|uniref:inner membrane transport protein yfav n=1 Tax=Phomopsis amygdali TaxID=1214568 RepID=UPI0022FDC6E8|nr:inner membrane transport protein yfav [Diaporthe amygdali]KAJ0121103.1 inner membrane transport protein yfav [Diaporthe amygdali]